MVVAGSWIQSIGASPIMYSVVYHLSTAMAWLFEWLRYWTSSNPYLAPDFGDLPFLLSPPECTPHMISTDYCSGSFLALIMEHYSIDAFKFQSSVGYFNYSFRQKKILGPWWRTQSVKSEDARGRQNFVHVSQLGRGKCWQKEWATVANKRGMLHMITTYYRQVPESML